MKSGFLTFELFVVVLVLLIAGTFGMIGLEIGRYQATDRCQHVLEVFLGAKPQAQRLLCEVK